MDRDGTIRAFLAAAGWGAARLEPLAGDASARRYLRARAATETAVLMDAPPPQTVAPFVDVAGRLAGLGLSAPAILAADQAAGLLLLEDFGDGTFTQVLADGADETTLYSLAVDALVHKDRAPAAAAGLPSYDADRALEGLVRFTEWFAPAVLGKALPPAAVEAFRDGWLALMPVADAVPSTLVLFDYHAGNLMLLPDRAGAAGCGLLDFQDAVRGPVTFDLVSLLQDARRTVPADLGAQMRTRYLDAFPGIDAAAFEASYAVLGAQRATRIIGTFTRLDRRDGKPGYLRHIPRVWRWLEQDLAHPALAPMRAWFDDHVPAAHRVAPPSRSGEAA